MENLLELLLAKAMGAPSQHPDLPAAPAPKSLAPPPPDLDAIPHPFFSQLWKDVPKPWQRGVNRASDQLERARWIPKDAMLRPEDAGDYSLQDYDRLTQGFLLPDDVRKWVYEIYDRGSSRRAADTKAGRNPNTQEHPVRGGKY